jgi:type III secretion protein HrpB1
MTAPRVVLDNMTDLMNAADATNAMNGRDLVAGMTGVLWAGTRLDTLADLKDLLAAIVVLEPQAGHLCVAIAWWHVRCRSWTEALRELRRAEGDDCVSALGTALSAACLYALGDPAWHTYACAAAWQTGEPQAAQIALALMDAPDAECSSASRVGESGMSSHRAAVLRVVGHGETQTP